MSQTYNIRPYTDADEALTQTITETDYWEIYQGFSKSTLTVAESNGARARSKPICAFGIHFHLCVG